MEAYILIGTEPGILWKVAEVARKVEFQKIEELGKIIEKIQHINGVRRTQTLIALPPTIRE